MLALPNRHSLPSSDTIDMHHGIYSADPPYTVICVIGAALTATVRAAVSPYGSIRSSLSMKDSEQFDRCRSELMVDDSIGERFTGNREGNRIISGLPTIHQERVRRGERVESRAWLDSQSS